MNDSDRDSMLVAAIDIGTTSTRSILFHKSSKHVANHQIEYSTTASIAENGDEKIFSADGLRVRANQFVEIENVQKDGATLTFPSPGWVEVDPVHIISNAIACLAATKIQLDAVNKERKEKNEKEYKIMAIGIANMRETLILWSKKTGKAVYNGIVWNDTRTSDMVSQKLDETSDADLDRIRNKCGLKISTYFSAAKLRWLLDNDPQVNAAYEAGDLMFGTVDTWLMYHITAGKTHATDLTNASRTMFMDINTFKYDQELFDFWSIDPKKLTFPEIRSSSEFFGNFQIPDLVDLGSSYTLSPEAHSALESLGPKLPITGVLGDQSASMVGQLALRKGSAKCTYGTGCFLLYNTGDKQVRSENGSVTTVAYHFPHLKDAEDSKPHYALEGSIAVAGSCVQWLRDNLKLINSAAEIGPLASLVPNTGGVVFVPAFSGLFAPYWDSQARGSIFGITQYTTSAHIARAALEGICYQARAIMKAMGNDAGASGDFLENAETTYEHGSEGLISQLAIDGGLSKSDEFVQIQADILGPCVAIRRTPVTEATALGAAIAAGVGFENDEDKLWTSLADVEESLNFGASEVFRSKLETKPRRENWERWTKAVEKAKGWTSQNLDDSSVEEMEEKLQHMTEAIRLKKLSDSQKAKAKGENGQILSVE